MNFDRQIVNYVNETSLGKNLSKDLSEDTDWKAFYKMAKDTSGETHKEFEKKYGSLLDKPHVADAVKNAKDFNAFLKHIKKFEK